MAFRLSTTGRNKFVDGFTPELNSGKIRIRTGSQETNVGDSDGGTLLATLTFGSTAFGSSSSGTATANAITSDTSAAASGTAGHFRLYKSDNSTIEADGTCGQGSGDMSFDNSSIVAGGTVAISSFTISQPIS